MAEYPHEEHGREQYFFDPPTLTHLAEFISGYERPCVVCAPMVGQELVRMGVNVAVLDVDRRFASLPGFVEWNMGRPVPAGPPEGFGLIVCDPPFFALSLSTIFRGLRMLSRFDFSQPLLVAYLERRIDAALGTFAPFGVTRTGYAPGYLTVQDTGPGGRNRIEFVGNLGEEAHVRLRAGEARGG